MPKLDKLLNICATSGIHIERTKLPANLKAIYFAEHNTAPVISIDYSINTRSEAACILAEEVGHYYTSSGNLLTDSDLHKTIISKQESVAKRWAFKYMISLSDIIDAHRASCSTLHEVAEFLCITEDFLKDAARLYANVYGTYIIHDGYKIFFDPLWVISENEDLYNNID